MSEQPTRSQKNFLNKLSENSEERQEAIQVYLRDSGKGSIDELSISEASALIDKITKIKDPNEKSTGGPSVSKKQLNFISNLQDTEERIAFTSKYLKSIGKKSTDELVIKEASTLIDSLMSLKSGTSKTEGSSDFKATPKQINFLKSLQKSKKETDLTGDYLKKLKKVSLEELSRSEASELIEKLKG
jgi:hypothetical protein